jgi:hypothetical protein
VVRVLEGESKVPDQCTAVARAVLRDLPPGLPENWPIMVNYEYRANGRVDVTAAAQGTDRNLLIEMVRDGGLNDQRLARWKSVVTIGAGFEPFARLVEGGTSTVQQTMPTRPQPITLPQPIARPQAPAPLVDSRATAAPAPLSPNLNRITPSADPDAGYKPQIEALSSDTAMASDPFAADFPAENPAADEPQDEDDLTGPFVRRKRRRSNSGIRSMINLVAHLMSSVLGLALGYYILCWIKPESNFLHLNLPLLPPPAVEKPDLPAAAPADRPNP